MGPISITLGLSACRESVSGYRFGGRSREVAAGYGGVNIVGKLTESSGAGMVFVGIVMDERHWYAAVGAGSYVGH